MTVILIEHLSNIIDCEQIQCLKQSFSNIYVLITKILQGVLVVILFCTCVIYFVCIVVWKLHSNMSDAQETAKSQETANFSFRGITHISENISRCFFHSMYYPASKEYGTHMGPRWVIIWVLYGQPIWDRCGFCNRDSSGTHLGTSIWAPYGPHIEFPI